MHTNADMEFLQAFGHRLKCARTQLRLNGRQTAELSGISQAHFSDIERGKSSLNILTMVKILGALNTQARSLGLKREPTGITAEQLLGIK